MQDILDAIKQYAEAYKRLERIQRARPQDIPVGDQKTGVIAEFFARIYARNKFPDARIEFGSPSEPTWDIKVCYEGRPEMAIQVKAVSSHSETSRISTIHPGWHQLWLMRLNEELRPEALWVVYAEEIAWAGEILKNRTMPKIGLPESGSAEFRRRADVTQAFLSAIENAPDSIR